jgi:cytochrome b subunit of formate dehydrogenase
MTTLLVGVFTWFGIHMLLWIPRSIQERKKKKLLHKQNVATKYYIRRFTSAQRITHLFVIISFLLLALTGMVLKFANMDWAANLAKFIGGIEVAGRLHRFGAIITFGYFLFHLGYLVVFKSKRKVSFKTFAFGENSLLPNLQDVKDFWATIKWFVGKGPKPNYGRWTYWEKFDYLAVFWGVAIIGFSGLLLWFPEFFTKVFPGWLINVAQIIHSDEALLAVGFIFTYHFFNTHLRPDAFPMDTVIFTGLVPFEEFRYDRPREYKYLKESGRLKKVLIKLEGKNNRNEVIIRIFGFLFVITGLILVGLIIYSMLVGYVFT